MSDKSMKFKATGVVVIFGTIDIECDEKTHMHPAGVMEVTPFFTLIQQKGNALATQDVPAMKQLVAHAMLRAATERYNPGAPIAEEGVAPMTTDELSTLLRGGDPTVADLILKRQGIVAQCEDCHDADLRTCRYSSHWVCEKCLTVLKEMM